jgi:hypothetical protein
MSDNSYGRFGKTIPSPQSNQLSVVIVDTDSNVIGDFFMTFK